jgi:hypothetical protein
MTITTANIDIGDLPNDGTGDPLRTAFDKINENFAALANGAAGGPNGTFQFNEDGTPNGTANFAYVTANNTIQLGANILPSGNVTIGTSNNRISNLYLGNTSLRLGNIQVTETGNVLSFPISVLPTNKASLEVNNIVGDGNVTVSGSFKAPVTEISGFEFTTSNNAANQVILEIPAGEIKTGLFQINSRETSSNNSQFGTVAINKAPSNTGVNYSVYGTMFGQGGLAVLTNYDADLAYGNVRLRVTPLINAELVHTVSYQKTT